jgi:3-oxoadipate enol-lactonase
MAPRGSGCGTGHEHRPTIRGVTNAPEWRTARIERDGESLYYEVTGDADARTVVLTHGAGGTHASWFQQVPALTAAGYRVVTWDSRGFGNSTCSTGTLGADVAAADLAAILDAVGAGTVDLVGQSMGGWWVSAFTIAHPERVTSLTLANTIGGLYTPALHAHFRSLMTEAPPDVVLLGSHSAVSARLFARDPALAFLYQQLDSFHDAPMVAVARALTGWEVTHDQMNATRVPLLIVTAPDDQLFPAPLIKDGATRLHDARVVEIAGAGHSPYFERASDFNTALLAFLSEHVVHSSPTG